jgi:hypothetical protein
MSIIRFAFKPNEIPENAVNVQGVHYQAGIYKSSGYNQETKQYETLYAQGPSVYWIWEEYVGLCLKDTESNGYDDSDFHMLIWNPETKTPFSITFASTRGWSYPSYNSFMDATPEVRQEYNDYLKAQARRNRIQDKWDTRRSDMKLAAELELGSLKNAKRFREAFNGRRVSWDVKGKLQFQWSRHFDSPRQYTFLQACKLLKAKKLKNAFKISMQTQICNWVNDPSSKYNTPLSPKQREYL